MFKCGRIGTKELELVLTQYLQRESPAWSYNQLEAFDKQILSLENPQLVKYLMNEDDIMDKHKS